MQANNFIKRFADPTFLEWFAGASLIGLVILNAVYTIIFSDNTPSLEARTVIKAIAIAMAIFATIFVLAIKARERKVAVKRNKTIILPLILALLSAAMLFIPAQAAQNASVPANISQAQNASVPANISQVANQTTTVEQVIETVFLIGIILSPLSFIIAVVALWVAWKNRRTVYKVT